MNRLFLFMTILVLGVPVYAQSEKRIDTEEKQENVNSRELKKQLAAIQDSINYKNAVSALEKSNFVLEADQLLFKRGGTAFVSSNTNFVMLNGQRATVQVAFNTPYPGPNGIGGVTVDGTTSDVKVTTDKRGNVNCNFSVQGIGISAQVFITLTNGGNNATVTINPNFNSNTLTLSGNLVPLNQSDVFKGRSW